MYLSLNLPTLQLEKIKWHEDKIIDKSSNTTINLDGKLGYWACSVVESTYKKLQKIFPQEIISNSNVLVQFLRASVNNHPHKDSYPWTFMYMLDDADGHTNLYNDEKEIISSHVTKKGQWALLKSWEWHSPESISKDKIRKALVVRIKKDYGLDYFKQSFPEIKNVA